MKEIDFNLLGFIYLLFSLQFKHLKAQECPISNGCLTCDTSNWSPGNTVCASTAISQCSVDTGLPISCFPGYGFDAGNSTCTACDDNTYSTQGGPNGCIPCFDDDNLSISTCDSITGNISSCLMDFDLVNSDGILKCLPSTYTSDNCTGDHASWCNALRVNETHSCDAGYGLAFGNCLGCLAGTFSLDNTTTSCSNCSSNTFSDDIASSCFSCATGYNSTAGSACVINCPDGTYVDSTMSEITGDSSAVCKRCPEDSNAATCSFSNVTQTVDSLTCVAGFSLPVNNSGVDGNFSRCEPCSTGSWSNGTTPCQTCLSASTSSCSSRDGLSLHCSDGHGIVNNTCVICQGGSFSSILDAACLPCAVNETSLVGATSCVACTTGTYTTSVGSTSCILDACVAGSSRNSSGICGSCLTPGVASCDAGTGFPNSCLENYGYTPIKLNTGVSFSPVCVACPNGSFSLGGTTICLPCFDTKAATCNSTELSGTQTCLPNYSLIDNVCSVLAYSRYYGYSMSESDASPLESVIGETFITTSESKCWEHCQTSLAKDEHQDFVYQTLLNVCSCRSSSSSFTSSSIVLAPGFVTGVIGACSNFTESSDLHCQTVRYTNSTGCIGIDGVTPCINSLITHTGCTDPNAATCEYLHLDLSLTCSAGFGLSSSTSDSESPTILARQAEIIQCRPCSVGTWSNGTESECSTCLSFAILACLPTSGDATICNEGHTLTNGTCSLSSPISVNCRDINAATCDPVSKLTKGCNGGYGLVFNQATEVSGAATVLTLGGCSACLAGSFSPVNSAIPCQFCPINSTSSNMATSCVDCDVGSHTAAIGSTVCTLDACTVGSSRNASGICASCLTPGVASCDAGTGFPNSCLENYGYTPIKLNTGVSFSPVCVACPNGSFSLGGTTICLPCFDTKAATCNSTELSGTQTCLPNYSLVDNVCSVLAYSRYYGYNILGSDLGAAFITPSENTCWAHCQASTLKGNFQNFAYQATNSLCLCKSSPLLPSSSLQPVLGFVSTVVGPCTNSTLSDLHCQTVKYNITGCVSIDGVTPCITSSISYTGCIDSKATSCESEDPNISLTCNRGYVISNTSDDTSFFKIGHCAPCPVDSWSNGTSLVCSSCISNSTASCSPITGIATVCKTGYQLIAGICILSTPTPINCETNVLSCDSLTLAARTCKGGYGLVPSNMLLNASNGSTAAKMCSPCPAGSFAAANSTLACQLCPINSTSSSMATSCVSCDVGSHTAAVGSTVCTLDACAIGSIRNSLGICVTCLKAGVATCNAVNGAPTSCLANYGFVAASISSTGVLTPVSCTPCPISYYSAGGTSKCSACTDRHASTCINGTTSLTTSLTCLQGYFPEAGLCQPSIYARYVGYTSETFGIVPGIPGILNETACVRQCQEENVLNALHSYVYDNVAPSQCYCLTSTTSTLLLSPLVLKTGSITGQIGECSSFSYFPCTTVDFSSGVCINAIDGSNCTTVGKPTKDGCTDQNSATCDSQNLDQSLSCDAGYAITPGSDVNRCQPCPSQTWSNGTLACKSCQSASVFTCSPTTGMPLTCAPTYQLVGTACVTTTNSGCLDKNALSCISQNLSTSLTCNHGSAVSPLKICQECANGMWSNGTAGAVCIACSSLTTSTSTCSKLSGLALSCNLGYALLNAINATCIACPAGTFGTSNSSCSVCPINTYMSQTAASSCLQCISGYTTNNVTGASICVPITCPAGTYKTPTGTSTLCTKCPDIYAATCGIMSSSTSVGSMTCVPSYILKSNICQPNSFARYTDLSIYQNDITSSYGIQSEAACLSFCTGQNQMNGTFQSFTYSDGRCQCKGLALTTATFIQVGAYGVVSNFVGTCSNYTRLANYNCQNVTFQSNGCMGIDGTACRSPSTTTIN